MSSRWLLSSDPPAHTRLRALVNKAFTPSVVEDLRPRVQQLADDLIAAAERAGTFDLIGDVAFPLSFTVITEILGVRPEDLDTFRKWSSTVGDGINLRQGTQSIERASAATLSLMDYFRAVVADRRDHSRPDLISRLVEARDMHDRLSEDELLSMCIQLIFAGHETTVNHIGNGMLALLRHPEQRELLRRRPDLIDGAVNELLRLDSPVQTCAARKPIEDVEIGGKRVRAGEPVIAFVGAANRDPDVFPEPDRLDITRDGAAHLAFGTGIHACLAGALARMEGAVAIGTLLERLPDLRLVDAPLEWRPHAVLRGLAALPVSVR
jgi:cytochrome P450